MRLATASINTTALDLSSNATLIRQSIRRAYQQSIDCLLLPELCLSGYGCEDFFFCDDFLAQTLEKLTTLIAEIPTNSTLIVVVGLPLAFKGLVYNTAACISTKGIEGIYAKQHLANHGVHYESRWFEPWPAEYCDTIDIAGQAVSIGEVFVECCGTKVGIEICEDAWVSQRPAHRYVQHGVTVILNPSASHFARDKQQKRLAIVESGSLICQGTYAYCNLVGCEAGRTIYDGANLIAHQGKWLVQKAAFDFHTATFQWVDLIHPSIATKQLPSDNDALLQAAALGLWDWQRKTHQQGFVVSLSGGADSALCAVLVLIAHRLAWHHLGTNDYLAALRDLGINDLPNVLTLSTFHQSIMPRVLTTVSQQSKFNSEHTLDAALSLADALGSTHYHWQIDDLVDDVITKVVDATQTLLTWQQHDIVLQNIQARVRAPGVWCLANLEKKLLLTTANLSEATVGYCTMDGDTAGVLAPIGGLAKQTVMMLNRYLADVGMIIGDQCCHLPALAKINRLPPSAELRPEPQADEQDLPPYEIIDFIRQLAQVRHLAPRQWLKAMLEQRFVRNYTEAELQSFVVQFKGLYARNQWKRERIAPSFHLEKDSACPKTYRRLPILNALAEL